MLKILRLTDKNGALTDVDLSLGGPAGRWKLPVGPNLKPGSAPFEAATTTTTPSSDSSLELDSALHQSDALEEIIPEGKCRIYRIGAGKGCGGRDHLDPATRNAALICQWPSGIDKRRPELMGCCDEPSPDPDEPIGCPFGAVPAPRFRWACISVGLLSGNPVMEQNSNALNMPPR